MMGMQDFSDLALYAIVYCKLSLYSLGNNNGIAYICIQYMPFMGVVCIHFFVILCTMYAVRICMHLYNAEPFQFRLAVNAG